MDRVSESLLNEFSQDRGLTHLSEEDRFAHFCCFITVGRHYPETFDTEDLLVGKATGIDGIAIIVNDTLITDIESLQELDDEREFDVTFVFVQADRGSNFDAAKIGHFGFAVGDFFKEKNQLPRNAAVSDAAKIMAEIYKRSAKFKRGNPACRLYFATTGTLVGDPILEARCQTITDDLQATNLFREVEVELLGAEGIQKLYRQNKNAVEREFLFNRRITISDVPGVTQAYLGFLPLPELMKIITDDTGEMLFGLFNSNPRDWQGYNDVNTEMMATLRTDDKNRFVLMNNGLTIIARDIRPTGDKFVIEDYQIVNGCQTCHVLFAEAQKDDASIAVPVRLIGTQDEAVINSIIRSTNRQTFVTEDQFFALQEFPKQLEQFFQAFPLPQRLYYERRSKQYERLQVEKTRVIIQSNVIKAFAAMFLQEAHRTTRNYAALKAKVGTDIFGKGHRKEPYYTAAFAYYKLEYLFRSQKLEAEYKPARFHILLAFRMLANQDPQPRHMNSREMEAYCKPIMETLWDPAKADDYLLLASQLVKAAVKGDFDRDNIRTEPTTKAVTAECLNFLEELSHPRQR